MASGWRSRWVSPTRCQPRRMRFLVGREGARGPLSVPIGWGPPGAGSGARRAWRGAAFGGRILPTRAVGESDSSEVDETDADCEGVARGEKEGCADAVPVNEGGGLADALGLPDGATRAQLEASMAGHVLAQGLLVGVCSRA